MVIPNQQRKEDQRCKRVRNNENYLIIIIAFCRPKASKPDENEDPGAGLMKMMQKLYDEGDDDMKRTIKKAWHDSQEKRAKGEEIM